MFGLFKKKKQEPVEVAPDQATLYVSDPSLLGSKVLDTMPGILSYEGTSDEAGNATGLRLRLKAGELIMNFMPAHMIEEHLAGMSLCGASGARQGAATVRSSSYQSGAICCWLRRPKWVRR